MSRIYTEMFKTSGMTYQTNNFPYFLLLGPLGGPKGKSINCAEFRFLLQMAHRPLDVAFATTSHQHYIEAIHVPYVYE